MKKTMFIVIILLFSNLVFGTEPIRDIGGTLNNIAIPNEFIELNNIKFFVNIKKEFISADINIIYTFNSEKSGFQIPFLFYINVSDSLEIKVNDKIYKFSVFDKNLSYPDTTIFKKNQKYGLEIKGVDYCYGNRRNFNNNPFFFYPSIELTKGENVIEIHYTAYPNKEDTRIFSYYYTFENLTDSLIENIESIEFHSISENIGNDDVLYTTKDAVATSVDSTIRIYNIIPFCYEIRYNPKISKIAEILLDFSEFRMSFFLAIWLYIFHVILVYRHRKTKKSKPHHLTLGLGFAFPIVVLFSIFIFRELISVIIGQHANLYSGWEIIFIPFWFVIFLVFYLTVIFFSDLVITLGLRIKNRKK